MKVQLIIISLAAIILGAQGGISRVRRQLSFDFPGPRRQQSGQSFEEQSFNGGGSPRGRQQSTEDDGSQFAPVAPPQRQRTSGGFRPRPQSFQDELALLDGPKQTGEVGVDGEILPEGEKKEEPDRLALLLQNTKFTCTQKKAGYYADDGLNCEVFHYCSEGVRHSWMCPAGTSFHQVQLICMAEGGDNICSQSNKYYFVNDYLYKPLDGPNQRGKNGTIRYSDRYFPDETTGGHGQQQQQQQQQQQHQPQQQEQHQQGFDDGSSQSGFGQGDTFEQSPHSFPSFQQDGGQRFQSSEQEAPRQQHQFQQQFDSGSRLSAQPSAEEGLSGSSGSVGGSSPSGFSGSLEEEVIDDGRFSGPAPQGPPGRFRGVGSASRGRGGTRRLPQFTGI